MTFDDWKTSAPSDRVADRAADQAENEQTVLMRAFGIGAWDASVEPVDCADDEPPLFCYSVALKAPSLREWCREMELALISVRRAIGVRR